jgi:hypothetical protein
LAVPSPTLTAGSVSAHRRSRLITKAGASGRALVWPVAAWPIVVWLIVLTPAVLLVHGYHPFSEDAGIYVAGVRKLVQPAFYAPDAPFVLANTRLSLFAHLLAAIVRTTRMPLSYLLLLTHLTSIFAFLAACWTLGRRIFSSPVAQWSAVALAGACFTMPIAGTSLMLMDPYVTARSFSTPLGLFALVAAIDHRWPLTAFLLLITGLMHPLMFIYAAAFVLLFVLVDLGRTRAAWSVSLLGILGSGAIYLLTLHAPVSAAYHQAVLSRSYLFPSQWARFEYLGLAVPLLLYVLALRHQDSHATDPHTPAGKLCLAAIMLGTSSTLSAFLFVHPSGPYFLARMQLLRSFHMLYLVGILLLGGFIGNRLIQRPGARLTRFALLAAAAVSMFFTQRLTYPLSAHIEFPRAAPRNPWEEAFVWIRANTPADAVFAANPDLVLLRGEEGQGFRVLTERSLLGDYKDEGVVVVFPPLGTQWAIERNAQAGLDRMTDAERVARLMPLGAGWLLLSSTATTSFACPYRNLVSQVCRLSPAAPSVALGSQILPGKAPAH